MLGVSQISDATQQDEVKQGELERRPLTEKSRTSQFCFYSRPRLNSYFHLCIVFLSLYTFSILSATPSAVRQRPTLQHIAAYSVYSHRCTGIHHRLTDAGIILHCMGVNAELVQNLKQFTERTIRKETIHLTTRKYYFSNKQIYARRKRRKTIRDICLK